MEQDDIFEACRVGALAKVKMFVEVKNTGLNGTDADKRSPLHWAAASGHEAIVEYLLEKGAHGDTVDDDGMTFQPATDMRPDTVQDGLPS